MIDNQSILKVGRDRFFDKKRNKVKKIGYFDIEYDAEFWADATKYLPDDLDLCFLKTATKTWVGWRSGNSWECRHPLKDADVLFWKRKERK